MFSVNIDGPLLEQYKDVLSTLLLAVPSILPVLEPYISSVEMNVICFVCGWLCRTFIVERYEQKTGSEVYSHYDGGLTEMAVLKAREMMFCHIPGNGLIWTEEDSFPNDKAFQMFMEIEKMYASTFLSIWF